MGDVIVVEFCTLDGVVSDPDGRSGTPYGGWAFKGGPVVGDKFDLGSRMERGVQLYGRRTWERFAGLWPARDGDFARMMNEVPKRVATRTGISPGAWSNSAAVEGDLLTWVKEAAADRDVIVIGSLSVVRALAAADLVDEYRLVTFPVVVGAGDRLFTEPADYRVTSAERTGDTTLTILRRA